MKITHVHPRAGAPWCKDQTPIGNGCTEADIWEEIREATMRDDVVVFIDTHQYAWEEFFEELTKERFDLEAVMYLTLPPRKKLLHIPAHGPISYGLQRASDGKKFVTEEPATPATTKEIEVQRYLDFSTKQHALHIAQQVSGKSLVVIWEPDVEAGDLDHLRELKNVDVVIFHRVSEKCGVVVAGRVEKRAGCRR